MSVRKLKNESTIEQIDCHMPSAYWARHKKPSIDVYEAPFASERQFEDQKFQIALNRNPQLNVPTKVEKVRSQLIQAKKGNINVLSMKAKVLNKIVREASGIHTYAIVAPIRVDNNIKTTDTLDPDTYPLVKPYRKETNRKPKAISYGHRPSSANRTFHPGTMKVR